MTTQTSGSVDEVDEVGPVLDTTTTGAIILPHTLPEDLHPEDIVTDVPQPVDSPPITATTHPKVSAPLHFRHRHHIHRRASFYFVNTLIIVAALTCAFLAGAVVALAVVAPYVSGPTPQQNGATP